jgi:phosphinothricin acetyltransferase
MRFSIRDAGESDAGAIAGIYAHHVLTGTASYDLEPPSTEDTRAKIRRIIAAGWPFLVADEAGEPVGYAYATQLRDRAAYRYTCENSIYVRADRLGRGIGGALLETLCARAAQCGFRQMVAVVGGAEPSSIALHERCGFTLVGRLSQVGFKHDRWLDTVYLQRGLGGE